MPICSEFLLFDLISSSFQRKRPILIVSVKNNQWQLFTITTSWGRDTPLNKQELGQNFKNEMSCGGRRQTQQTPTYFWGLRRPKSCAGLCTCPEKTYSCTYLSPLADLRPSASRKWRLREELWMNKGWWYGPIHTQFLNKEWKTYCSKSFKEISKQSLPDH